MNALFLFYYLLLAVSVALFFATFRRSPFCMFLLCLYLIGHFYMVGIASTKYFQTVHNSRFFPVIAMLPTMHLLLLVLRREPASLGRIAAAIGQTALLYFFVFGRYQAIWQAGAVIASPVLVLQLADHAGIWRAVTRPREVGRVVKMLVPGTWPAMLTAIGLIAFVLYPKLAFDPAYRTETAAHTFWDVVLGGTISASPELQRLYADDKDVPYSDQFLFNILMMDLRKRNDTSPEIAFVWNGVIYIDPFKNVAVYEQLSRRLFFEIAAAHPWLTIKSFIYDKPRDQLEMLGYSQYRIFPGYNAALLLALAAALLTLASGHFGRLWKLSYVKRSFGMVILLAVLSSTTTLLMPSVLILDTLLFYLMLSLFVAAYLPAIGLSTLWSVATRKPHDASTQK